MGIAQLASRSYGVRISWARSIGNRNASRQERKVALDLLDWAIFGLACVHLVTGEKPSFILKHRTVFNPPRISRAALNSTAKNRLIPAI